ncbi:hypothetical protein HNP84_000816 [Thermocatellispora tengchongensis]|uniref:VWA domain-containing protein n=1 Tax=Thermocatellispora tengchongensis TaxID=1073253 RepID=A0A840P0X4_9ACTN|nr:substrate-binding domain-containing protein [Thermocatellispora tengchongensis]MBB5131110.1 hypothetical protein [Thermocatellispora tengchongensis]
MTDTVAGISVGALFALVASAPLEELPLRALIMAGLAVLGGVLFNVFGRMPGLLDGLRAAAVKSARLAAAAVRASARAGATVLGHLARAFLALAGGAAGLFKGAPRRAGAASAAVVLAAGGALLYTHNPWASCPIPREIPVTASSETAPAVRLIGEAYGRDSADWRGCRTAHVTVTAPESAEELRARFAGGWNGEAPGPRPVLWVADSPAEVEQVRRAEPVTLGRATTVATSPLVLAVPRATVDSAADPRPGRLDWAKLINGVSSSRSVVRTYARTSNTGLLATTGMYGTLGGDARAPERATLEARVSRDAGPAEDAHDVMCRYLRADDGPAGRIPAMILTEQQLYEFNRARAGAGGGAWTGADCPAPAPAPGTVPPLYPLYPAGGHALSYQCVPVTWPDRPELGDDLGGLLAGLCDRLARDLPGLGFRDADGDLPRLDHAEGLARDAAVTPGWPPEIDTALAQAGTAVFGDHVLMALDVSGSMSNKLDTAGSRLRAATDVARELVTHMRGRLTTGLWTFPSGPGGPDAPHAEAVPPEFVRDDGARLLALLDPIALAGPHPDGSLRELVRDGIAALRGKDGRRVLVILTDGGRPDGLSAADLADHEGTEVVVLAFGGAGCGKPAIAGLATDGLLTCYQVDGTPPDEALSTIRTDRATGATGGTGNTGSTGSTGNTGRTP